MNGARAARFAALLILAVLLGIPVYLTFVSGFFPDGALVRSNFLPPVRQLTLENFRGALTTVPLGRQYLVSACVVLLQTGTQMVTSMLAAYALVFPTWRGRTAAFALVVATLAVPGESLVIPNYELVSGLGLRDTLLGIVLPFVAAGYPVFLLRQAFAGMPRELWEASRLDGCGDLRSLAHIVAPACRGQLTTAGMWCALAAWNGFFWPLLITDSPSKRTVQVGLSQLVSAEVTSPATIFAGTALVMVPTVVLLLLGRRYLLTGLSRGVLR